MRSALQPPPFRRLPAFLLRRHFHVRSERNRARILRLHQRNGISALQIAAYGWNYRKAYFQDFDGKYYSVTISIAKDVNGNVVYNIGNMKEEASPKVKGSSAGNGNGPRGFASSDTSIRSEWQKGQEKFSAAEDVSESDTEADAAELQVEKLPQAQKDA